MTARWEVYGQHGDKMSVRFAIEAPLKETVHG